MYWGSRIGGVLGGHEVLPTGSLSILSVHHARSWRILPSPNFPENSYDRASENTPCRQPGKIPPEVVDLLVGASYLASCCVAGRLRIRPHGLNTANTTAMSRAVGETIGG